METKQSTRTPAAAIEAGWRLMRLVEQREQLDEQITAAVREVREAGGSWTTVGVALKTSRQAAQKRYADA